MISLESTVRGRLDLVFTAKRSGTVLAHAEVRAPLKVVRPFHLGDGRVLVQILALGPGLCAGDEYAIDVDVERDARVVIIMQSASRLIGMRDGLHASQTVKLRVDAGGHLEYYPGLTIPYRDSRFVQRVEVDAAADSRVGLLETWGTGRSMRGEHLAFGSISSRTVVRIEGAPAYADATELDPRAADIGGTGILEGHRYFASGFWHNASIEPARELSARDGVLAAFGRITPDRVYLRVLSRDGYAISEATNEAISMVNAAWGLAPIPLRRFTS